MKTLEDMSVQEVYEHIKKLKQHIEKAENLLDEKAADLLQDKLRSIPEKDYNKACLLMLELSDGITYDISLNLKFKLKINYDLRVYGIMQCAVRIIGATCPNWLLLTLKPLIYKRDGGFRLIDVEGPLHAKYKKLERLVNKLSKNYGVKRDLLVGELHNRFEDIKKYADSNVTLTPVDGTEEE